jgi:hypothetical protein
LVRNRFVTKIRREDMRAGHHRGRARRGRESDLTARFGRTNLAGKDQSFQRRHLGGCNRQIDRRKEAEWQNEAMAAKANEFSRVGRERARWQFWQRDPTGITAVVSTSE